MVGIIVILSVFTLVGIIVGVCIIMLLRHAAKTVTVGEVYRFKEDGENPFAKRKMFAKVKDVKKGWVLYDIVPGNVFLNQSMRSDSFLYCYELVKVEGAMTV